MATPAFSLFSSREIPSPDPCDAASPLLRPANATRTPIIYTYTPSPPVTTHHYTPSPCLNSTTIHFPNSSGTSTRTGSSSPLTNRNPSRFSDTPDYIPRSRPPSVWQDRGATGGSLQVRYPGLTRVSAPAILPEAALPPPPPPLPPKDHDEMPDLITFSPPVDLASPRASVPARWGASSPPPCYAPTPIRPGSFSSSVQEPGVGVGRRPSFKINLPRCPNPTELAAQLGRANGTGPAPRTYSRTPYPDEDGVDYLSRALDRVEVKCSRTSSSDDRGPGEEAATSPPRSETPGTLSPGSSGDDARSSLDSSASVGGGRTLPVVEIAFQDDPTPLAPVSVRFGDPWAGQAKTTGRIRGRQMARGRSRRGQRARHPADASEDEESDELSDKDEEDGEEGEHLLREQLGAPVSPHAHQVEKAGGFPGMLARVGRRISGQGVCVPKATIRE